jgi:hypothetical protein
MTEMRFALIESEDAEEFGREILKEAAESARAGALPQISFSHTARPDGTLHYAALVIAPTSDGKAEYEVAGP